MTPSMFALLPLLANGPEIASGASSEPYRVVGVSDWDTLLIRSKPSAKGGVLGAIPHDGVDVEVLKFGPEKKWAYVDYHDVRGWVFAAFLAPAAEVGAPGAGATCTGTEPFWSFQIQGESTRWQSPEGDLAAPLSEVRAAENRTNAWLLQGDGEIRAGVLVEDPGCSDGASEKSWDYAAWILLSDGRLVQGCCRAR